MGLWCRLAPIGLLRTSVEVAAEMPPLQGTAAQGSMLAAMEVEPVAFTPQGDAVNDEVRIGYTLLVGRARSGSVRFARPLLIASRSKREVGRHAVLWNGRDQSGRLVGPGLYLVRVAVETDRPREERMACVAVVY